MPTSRSHARRNTRPWRRKLRHCSVYTSRVRLSAERGSQSETKVAILDEVPLFSWCANSGSPIPAYPTVSSIFVRPYTTFFVSRLLMLIDNLFVWWFSWKRNRWLHFVVVRNLFDSLAHAKLPLNSARDGCRDAAARGNINRIVCAGEGTRMRDRQQHK